MADSDLAATFVGAYWAPPYWCVDCGICSRACMCAVCSSPYNMQLWTRQRLFLCHRCAVGADTTVKQILADQDKKDKDDKKNGKKNGKKDDNKDGNECSGKRARKA